MAMNLPAATNTLDLYISEINRFAILTPEEEFKLAVRYKKYNDMEAAEKLVVSNLRFVVKIAHEYRNYGVKLLDLVQEGNVGLMHAVKKFDPYKGYRLISYAVCDRAYMQNSSIRGEASEIGRPTNQRKLFSAHRPKELQTMLEEHEGFGDSREPQREKGGDRGDGCAAQRP